MGSKQLILHHGTHKNEEKEDDFLTEVKPLNSLMNTLNTALLQ